ncbi:enoyl-CoA hydratase [Croceicoccus estronivorus]|uniref:enoyl-CoA hydratase/isomerase family protein n=1 Tax=Croceicoccus estronivorus TaxID=1172626 RepID=UPI0008356F89|nr:enoyl-CoA hydratase-related protein [Croceicoccus estronivorus]OCC25732.1 enoyl-CoA hydratase [Croceicoccus estronivorus]
MGGRAIQFETLRYEVTDGVALITLDRPARLNSINSVMSRELPILWRGFEHDESAIVAIVTGAGDKAFCTGADLRDLPEMITDAAGTSLPESVRWSPLQNRVWKPVICAVNGLAMGGGLHFVAECDVVIASDTAEFSDPHVSVGLVSALETIALARRIPIGAVLRMALGGRGEKISAHRAHAIGMLDELSPPDELMNHAYALAERMRRNSPSAMARTKRAIWSSKEAGLGEATTRAWDTMNVHNRSHDFFEGVRAFGEGRDARWSPYHPDTES